MPFGCAALLASKSASTPLFLAFVSVYLLLQTLPTAPAVVGMMEAVPAHRRGLAMGLASFGSHIFGDVLSPVIVGALKDRTGSLLSGMWLLVLWGIWTVLFWGIASYIEPSSLQKGNSDSSSSS